MKKISTLKTILMTGALLAGLSADAQTFRGLTADEAANPTPAALRRAQLPASSRQVQPSAAVAGAGCDSIRTTYAGGNGNNGIMFNLVANQDLTVTFFDGVFAGDSGWVYIYNRSGSYIGNETTPGAWTLVDSVMTHNPIPGTPVRIPMYVGRMMNTGDTVAFYISGDGNIAVDYTNGTAENALYTQDFFLRVHEGRGMGLLWNTSGVPRVFNGNIYYCPPNLNPCQSDSTLFAGGNGADGNMFDITATMDVTINGFYGNINGSGYMKIYYRNGTYLGNETNPGAWTLIDSVMVTSPGANVPTLIPIPFNVPIPAGQTVAFYVTGNGSGADVNYTDGTTEGAVYSYDGMISIKEGKGMVYPFSGLFSPRIWNGMVDYCMGITAISQQEAAPASVNVFPNPFSTTATFAIETQQHVENMQLSIYDGTGRLVRQVNNITTPTVTVDREGLSAGMYFYQLTGDNQQLANGKLIVE